MIQDDQNIPLSRKQMFECVGGAPAEIGKKAEKPIELGFGAVVGSAFQSASHANQFPLWIGQAQQIGEGSAGLGPQQPTLNPNIIGD